MPLSRSLIVSIAGVVLCFAHCASEHADGSCLPSALEDDTRSLGTALLQASRGAFSKTNLSESSRYLASGAGSTRYAALERQVSHVEDEGVAVIVPGLGSEERAVTVERNIHWLASQDVPFECWVYVYLSEQEFPLDASRFEPCQVVRHAGHWLGHMLAMPLNMTSKPWIIHMEDGTEPGFDVNLPRIFEIMAANNLGHAAPTFDLQKDPNPYIESVYPILARESQHSIGRFVDFIELHFDVFTRKYFACLQDHIDTSNDDILIGWGMDRLLPAFCGGAAGGSEVPAGRMGLLDQMTMVKKHHGSYDQGAAMLGFKAFVAKHPDTPGPQFVTTGELEAPPRATS